MYTETFKGELAFSQIPIGPSRGDDQKRARNKTSCEKVYNSTLFDSTVREIAEG